VESRRSRLFANQITEEKMQDASPDPLVMNPDAMAQRLMQRAHNRDGLPEITAGLALLVAAGLIGLQVFFPRGSIESRAADMGFGLLIPVMIRGAPWAIKRVRRRYLIERVGYVEPNPVNWKRAVAVVGIASAVAGAVVVVIAASRRLFPPDSWILAETAIVLGAMAVLSGRSPRFMVGGALVTLAGVLIAVRGVSLDPGMAMLLGFAGLLALVSGVVVFWRFLRQPAEGSE
jgi:hypothetical protein